MAKRSKRRTAEPGEPPRPARRSGGPEVQAALASFRELGFDEDAASEIVTSTSRVVASLLAEGASLFDLMRAVVQLASNAVRGVRDDARRRRLPLADPACTDGCAHCCHLHVSVSAPEVLILAAYLRDTEADLASLRARIDDTAARVRDLDHTARVSAKIPCPLLEEGRCRAYVARPLSCAAATSLDAEACGRALDDPSRRIPLEPLQHGAIRAVRVGLSVALAAQGLDVGRYELANALSVALADDDVEARFFEGERLFARTAGDPDGARIAKTALAFVERDRFLPRT